ncbi:MAG TPA: DDE-type integrase/transposase/recombinase [Candidatus Micrarchaeia archaeon]|nr:DDE-type integrase/transposase/recombinase [Candidatus Micrarchaeia archaeon]
MNQLPQAQRVAVVKALVEGNSILATVRMTGVAKNTITKLLVDLGDGCAAYQDEAFRGLTCQRIECDEIWSFCYAKAKNVPEPLEGQFGFWDVWTWVAIDADSKLVPTWLVGDRGTVDAKVFMTDLAERLSTRVQLTTDGHRPYLEAVESAFGSEIDYAVLQKLYGSDPGAEKRYSPAQCMGVDVHKIKGRPNPTLISTSYVERQNLTMRMGMRRFTRLTNAFSKKVENLAAAVSLHFMHYNFARSHTSLANPYPRTPAMAAGVADHVCSVEEIVSLLG